jgi:hypothetical protein
LGSRGAENGRTFLVQQCQLAIYHCGLTTKLVTLIVVFSLGGDLSVVRDSTFLITVPVMIGLGIEVHVTPNLARTRLAIGEHRIFPSKFEKAGARLNSLLRDRQENQRRHGRGLRRRNLSPKNRSGRSPLPRVGFVRKFRCRHFVKT